MMKTNPIAPVRNLGVLTGAILAELAGEQQLYDDPITVAYGLDGLVADGFDERMAEFRSAFEVRFGVTVMAVVAELQNRVSGKWLYNSGIREVLAGLDEGR
jgi:hypothetical protein